MIEQIMDLVWWAVAASPLLMGNMGGGGGGGAPQQQATPPTLDLAQTTGLTQTQLNLLRDNIGPLSDAYGAANRSQESVNRFFGLRSLTDPGEDLGRAMEDEITPRIAEAQRELAQLERLKPTTDKRTGERGYVVGRGKNRQFVSEADYNARKAGIEANIERYNTDLNRARTYDPVAELTNTFSSQYAMRDRLLGDMGNTIGSTSEYNRFQQALGSGLSAQQVDQRRANLSQAEAAQMGPVADVSAQNVQASRMADFGRANAVSARAVNNISAGQVEAGALGSSLMNEAQRRVALNGQLSAEAGRDATQAARQAFAARGMATGNAAAAAELLNRDRFSRQRSMEDLGFAQAVQQQDVARQTQNVSAALEAARSNQSMAGQLSLADASAANQAELANLQARYNAAVQDGNWAQAAAIQNQEANLRASLANQQTAFNTGQFNAANRQQANLANMQAANNMAQFNTSLGASADQFNAMQRDGTNRYNLGLLGQSSALADAERTRQLAVQQDMYNFSMGTDPRIMLAGLGSPYANMTSPAASSLTTLASTTQPIYSGGSFTPQQMPNMPQYNVLGAGLLGLAGAGAGYAVGGPAGAFAGFGAGSSIGGQIR